MNIRKRKQRVLTEILLAVAFFLGGFLFVGVLGTELLQIPEKFVPETGKTYSLVNNSFQPATVFITAGCFMLMVSNVFFFDVIEMLRQSRYVTCNPFRGSRLALIAVFVLNLNFFTPNYFADMAEIYLKNKKADVLLERYEIFNLYFSEFLFALIIIVLIVNTGRKKIKWFGSFLSLLAIAQSVLGIISRTFTVKWLWYVYLIGLFLCAFFVFFFSGYNREGLGASGEDETVVKNVAYFVSPHGYGHIMRCVPVIAEILKEENTNVLLVSKKEHCVAALNYLQKYSGLDPEVLGRRFACEEAETDFGLAVQSGSLLLDTEKVREGIEQFTGRFPMLIREGVRLLEKYRITEVVSDICPWALASAAECEITSVLMASFTWIEIYEEYFPETMITPYRQCYHLADRVLLYELANKPTRARFSTGKQVGFVCRPIDKERVDKIRSGYTNGLPIVYFTVGLSNDGFEEEIDVSSLPYNFITTAGVRLSGPNVYAIEGICDHAQDYIAAADYCIIKSGWTTVSECMIAGVPMILIGRPDVAEDRMTIEMLEEAGCGMKIEPEELADIGAVMEKVSAHEWHVQRHENDASGIAREILNSV